MLLAQTGCREWRPILTIWPIEHDGLLPLVAASASSAVEERDGKLLAHYMTPADRVVSRGGHVIPASASPVLRLKARIETGPPVTMAVWAVAEGSTLQETSPHSIQIGAVPPDEDVEIFIPLASGMSPQAVLDLFGFGLSSSNGTLHIAEADVGVMTPWLAVRCWWQEFRALRGHHLNYYLLSAVVVFAIGHALLAVVLGLVRRKLGWPPLSRRVAVAAVGVLVVFWGFEAVSSVQRQAADFAEAISLNARQGQREQRLVAMERGAYGLARLVDAHVPVDEPVALLPAKSDMGSWLLINAVAPRKVLPVPCRKFGDLSSSWLGAMLACLPDVLEVERPASLEATDGIGWMAVIPPSRQLAGLWLEFDPATLSANETALLTIRDQAGKVLRRSKLGLQCPHVEMGPWPTPTGELRVELSIEGGDGRILLGPRGKGPEYPESPLKAWAVPEGWVVEADDAATANLVMRRPEEPPAPGVVPILPTEDRSRRLRETLGLGLALVIFLLTGEALLRLLFRKEEGPQGLERIAFAWIVGVGGVTLVQYGVSFVGLPHWPTPLIVVALVVWGGLRTSRVYPPARPGDGAMQPDEKALMGVAAGMAVLALGIAWFVPIAGWDELINWGYRGHVFHHSGPTAEKIADYAALSPRHKAYPPGVPLTQSFVTLMMGRWDDARATIPISIYYLVSGLLVFAAVRGAASRRMALLYAALLLTAPMMVLMSPLGMADLPLGCVMLAAMIAVDRWDGRRPGWILLAGACLALLSWMKLDGGALKLLVLGVALLKAVSLGRHRWKGRLGSLGGMVALGFLPGLPWWYTYEKLGLEDWVVNQNTLDPEYLKEKLKLLPRVFEALGDYLVVHGWGRGAHYNATYVVLAALLLLYPWGVLGPKTRWLAVALAGGILGYSFIYVVSPQGLYQMERSFDRILLHYYPLAVALTGRLHGRLIQAARS